jgi:hypothetical protein
MPRPPKNKPIPEPVVPVVAAPSIPAAVAPAALNFKAPPVIDVDQFIRVRDSVSHRLLLSLRVSGTQPPRVPKSHRIYPAKPQQLLSTWANPGFHSAHGTKQTSFTRVFLFLLASRNSDAFPSTHYVIESMAWAESPRFAPSLWLQARFACLTICLQAAPCGRAGANLLSNAEPCLRHVQVEHAC